MTKAGGDRSKRAIVGRTWPLLIITTDAAGFLWLPGTVIGQESATPDHATPADFALPQANELEADAAITVNDVPADPPVAFDPLAQLDGMTTVLDPQEGIQVMAV